MPFPSLGDLPNPGIKPRLLCLLHCRQIIYWAIREAHAAAAAAAKSLQSCPPLCDPIDGSLPGSSIHGIFQARVLEWGAIAFSAGKPIDLHKWREWNSSISGWVTNGILSLMNLGDNWVPVWLKYVLPWWLCGKESACNAEDMDSISGSGRSPGEGNGNLLQYSCQESSMDRGACGATVCGVAKESDTT